MSLFTTTRTLLIGLLSATAERLRPAREMIGGPGRIIRRDTGGVRTSLSHARDAGTTDYRFHDRVRKGKAPGFMFSGLLIKPLISKITAWMIGRPPTFKWTKSEGASEVVNAWWREHHATILMAVTDSLGLGDSYLVVNGDLSVSVLPPNEVTPLVSETDFSQVIGWRVERLFKHPSQPERTMRIRDDYTAPTRQRTIWVDEVLTVPAQTFPNFIGRVPVIPIPNRASADELFGRPQAEPMYPMLERYDHVLEESTEGVIRQGGQATPVIEGMEDAAAVQQFWDLFAQTRINTLPDGTEEAETYLPFKQGQFMTIGGRGVFNWKAPPPFMADTQALLTLYFYLFVQNGEIPEYALGAAVQGENATAQTQVDPLVKFIEMKRTLAESDWLKELVTVVQLMFAVFDPRARVAEDDTLQVRWDDLTTTDGHLTLETITWALDEGLLTRETALKLSPVEVENVPKEVAAAQAEKQAAQDAFDDGVERRLSAAAARDQEPAGDGAGQGVPIRKTA